MYKIASILILSGLCSISSHAADLGPKGQGQEGVPNAEPGQAVAVQPNVSLQIETIRSSEVLPNDDILLRLKTVKNRNESDSIICAHQLVTNQKNEIDILSKMRIGGKYAGKVDGEFLNLLMWREQQFLTTIVSFLRSKDPHLLEEFLDKQSVYTTTLTSKEPQEAKKIS